MADTTNMPELIRGLSQEKFSEIFLASTRQAREVYFHRHGIKAPKKSNKMLRAGQKNEIRAKALFELLAERSDEEMSEEVLRTWLLTKRPMLAVALDHLGIEHNEGLTDSEDVAKFEKLSSKELKALAALLKEVAPVEEVGIYLRYMGAPGVDTVL